MIRATWAGGGTGRRSIAVVRGRTGGASRGAAACGRHQPRELADVERLRLGVAGRSRCRAATGREQREVAGQLGVLADAVAQGLGDAVDLVEQHPGVGRPLVEVAGRGPGDQGVDVRRQAGRDRDGGGTSSCTCL